MNMMRSYLAVGLTALGYIVAVGCSPNPGPMSPSGLVCAGLELPTVLATDSMSSGLSGDYCHLVFASLAAAMKATPMGEQSPFFGDGDSLTGVLVAAPNLLNIGRDAEPASLQELVQVSLLRSAGSPVEVLFARGTLKVLDVQFGDHGVR